MPCASLTADSTALVATFFACTVTPGSTPPELSLTTPSIAPRSSWALPGTAHTTAAASTAATSSEFLMNILLAGEQVPEFGDEIRSAGMIHRGDAVSQPGLRFSSQFGHLLRSPTVRPGRVARRIDGV